MRRKTLNKIIHIAAKEGAAAETYLRGAVAENTVSIKLHQVGIGDRIHRHAGNHPDAKAKTDVGFDNVSIGGGEDDTRRQPGAVKGGIQLGAAGKPKGIGDQRVLGQLFNRHRTPGGQRMFRRHDNRTVPVIARQHDQIIIEMQRFGGDREISIPL